MGSDLWAGMPPVHLSILLSCKLLKSQDLPYSPGNHPCAWCLPYTQICNKKLYPKHTHHSTACCGSQVLIRLSPLFILVFTVCSKSGSSPVPSQLTLHRSLPQPSHLPLSCLPKLGSFPPLSVPWPRMSSSLFPFYLDADRPSGWSQVQPRQDNCPDNINPMGPELPDCPKQEPLCCTNKHSP